MKKDGKLKPQAWGIEGKKGNSKPKSTPAAMYRKGKKIEKYGGGGDTGQGGGGGQIGAGSGRYTELYDKKRKLIPGEEDVARKGRKIKREKYRKPGKIPKMRKKRYGGSVSYNSSSVRGYSKSYSGMGGEDE